MTHSKTKSGISLFDETFGGICRRKAILVCGHHKSGKTTLCTHFIDEFVQSGDNVLLMTDLRPEDFLFNAGAINIDFKSAISENTLQIISYRDMSNITGAFDPYAPLPYETAISELSEIIRKNRIHTIVFDTVVPWVAKVPISKMAEHTEKFTETLESLNITPLFVLPHPASPAAEMLHSRLESVSHTVIETTNGPNNKFTMTVKKYPGDTEVLLPMDIELSLLPGQGFHPSASPCINRTSGRILFSDVIK